MVSALKCYGISLEDVQRPSRLFMSRTNKNFEKKLRACIRRQKAYCWRNFWTILLFVELRKTHHYRRFENEICRNEICPPLIDCWPIAGSSQWRSWFVRPLENRQRFFSKIITGDKPWCHGYDPETKEQSKQQKSTNSPRPKITVQVKSAVKTIIICFFFTFVTLFT